MGVVEGVVAGDQPGQHARIGRVQVAGDDGDAHAGNRTHAEPAEHDDVAVATPDEDEVLEDGDIGDHHSRSGPAMLGCFRARTATTTGRQRYELLTRQFSKARSLCREEGKVKLLSPGGRGQC